MWELRKKSISQAVLIYETIQELQDRNLEDTLFGPIKDENSNKTFKQSLDEFMTIIDNLRKNELYVHEKCSEPCKKRGCENVATADGLWKLTYPICMWDNKVPALKDVQEFVPNVCVESTDYGKAFCKKHGTIIEKLGHPSGLRDFIQSCGADPNQYTKEGLKKVASVLQSLSDLKSANVEDEDTSGASQGTTQLLSNKQIMNKDNLVLYDDNNVGEEQCRKDVGDRLQLRRRSRGVEVFVTGGGIIRQWAPIYKVYEYILTSVLTFFSELGAMSYLMDKVGLTFMYIFIPLHTSHLWKDVEYWVGLGLVKDLLHVNETAFYVLYDCGGLHAFLLI